jgi:transposase InsO family protein
MSQRLEFVRQIRQGASRLSALCRQYGISRKTAYKWLARYEAVGEAGLADRSRRPHGSPRRTGEAMETAVLTVRAAHPSWGGRKIRAYLQGQLDGVPAASTITAILRRHEQLSSAASQAAPVWQRFERQAPNELWQMDFKGHFALDDGQRCHPLTVLDDCSRFLVGLYACGDETGATVRTHLTRLFQEYGLPTGMLMDNGPPWAIGNSRSYTELTVWLLRLDIAVRHSRPRHPQTLGKDERLHRTLKTELLSRMACPDLTTMQQHFDAWRAVYNRDRPHEALRLQPPATVYRPSPRPFPEQLPPIAYEPGVLTRKVSASGEISFGGRSWSVGRAFKGYYLALRPSTQQDVVDVYFGHHFLYRLDLGVNC